MSVHTLDCRNQNIGELFGLGEFLSAPVKQCNRIHGFKLYCFRTSVLNDLYSKILAKTLSVYMQIYHFCVHLFNSNCGLWVTMLCSGGGAKTPRITVGVFSATKTSNMCLTCMHAHRYTQFNLFVS